MLRACDKPDLIADRSNVKEMKLGDTIFTGSATATVKLSGMSPPPPLHQNELQCTSQFSLEAEQKGFAVGSSHRVQSSRQQRSAETVIIHRIALTSIGIRWAAYPCPVRAVARRTP